MNELSRLYSEHVNNLERVDEARSLGLKIIQLPMSLPLNIDLRQTKIG